ncbi:hypothetical protein FVP74_02410 [Microbacterium saccharophilum]|uniref:Uncharacterized protein n=1 Tax=Microbacterium saccharophilum TaxID=1213358 RepID=A0A5C8IAF8_9MICO|nr:hypothetical protein [Microbacterium saccharophilum]TXK15274.1 hypothetical protein FVP74_02410 [Microbacterium saccharophilum]GEP46969.1 hypothetical protein MSA03_04770 [Microbacterium saccharophilum]
MRLRVDIDDDQILASVDGAPILSITRPLEPPQRGTVGLLVDIGTEAFFSDLTVTAVDGTA